jgi:hypothetical protein
MGLKDDPRFALATMGRRCFGAVNRAAGIIRHRAPDAAAMTAQANSLVATRVASARLLEM